MDFISKSLWLFLSVILILSAKIEVGSSVTTDSSTNASTAAGAVVSSLSPKPATKKPISCVTGTCKADECTNQTVIAAFKKGTCAEGICVTEKTASTSTYNFKCSSKDCAADKTAAPPGTDVSCCEQPDCNTYEALNSSATRMYSILTALLTVSVLTASMFM